MIHFNKYTEILEEIKKTKGSTEIVAISKNHQMTSVENAIKKGVRIFGENRVIEAKNKFKDLITNYPDIELHLTGPLQSNKANLALDIFDVIQTVDREKIALKLNNYLQQRTDIKKKKFFIQVNVGEEKQKSGISINLTEQFFKWCSYDLKLNITGLMCIPPFGQPPEPFFKKLRNLCDRLNLEHASMGMTNDYKSAINHGATFIRVGTGIFGERN